MSDWTADDILTGVTEGDRARRYAAEAETFGQRLQEVLADPEIYTIAVTGRNGKQFTFNYPVPEGYVLELDSRTENDDPPPYDPWIVVPSQPVLKWRFHGITVRRRRDTDFKRAF